MAQGKLYIFSAPSGTGKSSLIKALLKTPLLHSTYVSISHTTRMPRVGEINGEHYFFVDQHKFESMINRKLFLEYAKVFGNYYGTSRKIIEKFIKNGVDVILDIDWQGAQQIRKKMSHTRSIFILPPSKSELERRLRKRDQDNEDIITNRIAQAVTEISHYSEYDYLIINDNFNIALDNLRSIILAERLRINQKDCKYRALIKKLLVD